MKPLLILIIFILPHLSIADQVPELSIDVFITESKGKTVYTYQGNKKDKKAMASTYKSIGRAMGGSIVVALHINSKLSLNFLHQELKTLKQANIKKVKLIINQKDGSAVVIPMKMSDLDFDFQEVMLEGEE